jgi:hypothetical protein
MRENILCFWLCFFSLISRSLVLPIVLWMTWFHSSLLPNKTPLSINIIFIYLICWWVPRLIPFLLLWIVPTINMGVQVCLLYAWFLQVYIQGWCSWIMWLFYFLRILHTYFYSDWINLHSHQQCKFPFSPTFINKHQCLLSVFF